MWKHTAQKKNGYTLVILAFAIFILSLGLLLAVPIWQTQIQRELESELIFRGKQYVEAVRLYQLKTPGKFPDNIEELVEENFLRRPFPDPMTAHGEWNIILNYQSAPTTTTTRRPGVQTSSQSGGAPQKIMIAPLKALGSIRAPQIIGVVSSSTHESKRIYFGQTSYDKWLFYYGQDPEKLPEIIYYGQESKK
jgi:type II secretory pathway pseudopilin PulG